MTANGDQPTSIPEGDYGTTAEEDESTTIPEREEEEEIIRQTAPDFPWELVFKSSQVFFQKHPGGAMAIKFAASMAGPQGMAVMPPGVEVRFSTDGWQQFKRLVEADGEIPKVHVPGAAAILR